MQSTMLQPVLLLSIAALLCQYPATTEARSVSYLSGLLDRLLASRFDDIIAANDHLVRAETSPSTTINVTLKENDKVVFCFTAPNKGVVYLRFLKNEGDTKYNVPMYIAIHYAHNPHHYVQLDCYEKGEWRLVTVGSGFDFFAEKVTLTVKVRKDKFEVYTNSGFGGRLSRLATYPYQMPP